MDLFSSVLDELYDYIPEYYDDMYKDGYEQWQIDYAFDKKENKEIEEIYKNRNKKPEEKKIQYINVIGTATLNGKKI